MEPLIDRVLVYKRFLAWTLLAKLLYIIQKRSSINTVISGFLSLSFFGSS